MTASRLDRVQVDVAGDIIEITWDERDTLLRKLRPVAGCEPIAQRFEAVGASRPVELGEEQRARLRVALEFQGVSVLPEGLMDFAHGARTSRPGRPRRRLVVVG